MARPQRRARRFDSRRRRKVSILTKEKIDYVDYKDVTLLRRFISDRAKIRPRRVTGNNEQQQRAVALAIKNAREMALLPYENRITTQRRSSDRRSYEPEDAPEGTEASNTASDTASSMAGNTAGSEGTRERRPGGAAASIPPPPRMQAAEPAGEDADQDKAHEAASAIEDSSADKSEEESAAASEQASEETAEAEDGESPTEEVPEEQQ